MSSAKKKTILAQWREAGEWWSASPQLEWTRYIDDKGIRRETSRELPSLGIPPRRKPKPMCEDHREEWSLRARKVRDVKVAEAMGIVPREKGNPHMVGTGANGRYRDYYGIRENKSSYGKSATCQPTRYASLFTQSGYDFGSSTILAEEIARLAAEGGFASAAIVDTFSLVGAVEHVKTCRKHGIKPILGANFILDSGEHLVLYARSKIGYEQLSQLISECHLGEPRLFPMATWSRIEKYTRDLICLTGNHRSAVGIAIMHGNLTEAENQLRKLIALYGNNNVFIQIERCALPWQNALNEKLLALAEHCDVLPVAAIRTCHATSQGFPAQDILHCAHTLCTVEEIIGRKPTRHDLQPTLPNLPTREINAERYFRRSDQLERLYADRPELLENTFRFSERIEDDVLPSRTHLPQLFDNPGHTLREVTYLGAYEKHRTIEPRLRKRLEHELSRIIELNFAGHFLATWDACRWAEEQKILFSGRGSVVDCAVAYCLGISRIDAFRHRLHFDRFLPDDGSKRPDIDIDFEAKRRDDVRNYFIRKYGHNRVASVAAIGAYCTRGIIREVGKALGIPQETISYLAKRLHGGVSPDQLESALEKRPELAGSPIPKERFQWVFSLAEQLMDVPRNMRAHSSGVVISSRPIAETVPVMWSAGPGIDLEHSDEALPNLRIIQWDKRSCKYFFDKFDILCLRGQDVLSGVQERIRVQNPNFQVTDISLEDPETYRTMRAGELIGIPQSASPAMRQAHIRLRTENLTDASLVQAGIRPGVGGAVKINELIARRRGKPFAYEHPLFEKVLGNTYGIVVFQEQIDMLLQEFVGCSSGEAEDLRESIHKHRREDYGEKVRDELVARVVANGFSESVASHTIELVAGFKGYGFAQGHALAFAEISVRSIYCQQHFPAEYFCAILSAQPAGYYGPTTLANEARNRGVIMLPPDVLLSDELYQVEDVQSLQDPQLIVPRGGVRVGLMQVLGLNKETRKRIVETGRNSISGGLARTIGASRRNADQREKQATSLDQSVTPRFASFFDFCMQVNPNRDELEQLILCGALDSLCSNRRAMLWAIPSAMHYMEACESLRQSGALPLGLIEPEINLEIEDFTLPEKSLHERRILDLDVHQHLMQYEREWVASKGGITAQSAKELPAGRKAIVVGNPIRLRFPPTPSGKRVVFFDLEDETGLLNVTCFDATYRRDGHAIVCSPYVTIIGEAQDRDGHTAFLAKRVFAYRPKLLEITPSDTPLPITTADFLVG